MDSHQFLLPLQSDRLSKYRGYRDRAQPDEEKSEH